MPLTLYAALVPSYIQILQSLSRLVTKAETHCTENSIAPEHIITARLAPDMLPFAYQIKSAAVHSIGAIESTAKGSFSPDSSEPPTSFAGLKSHVDDAVTRLKALRPEDLEPLIGRDMRFAFGNNHIDFLAEDFLLSFSQPNFYFHATTAYDILRNQGLAIGKRDFTGAVRKK